MNFIKKRGRISRTDLVIECNRLIKMNPSEEVKKRKLNRCIKYFKGQGKIKEGRV